ncbi:MAG: Ldh family oxidoreductase [Candidatus Poribacteria bacterium]|nr:Ldh family oxidoreductase [Candidatus Poribacteria bacterium]
MPESHNFQASHLHSIVRRLFVAAGTPLRIAQDVAEILVNANLAGHDSHGVLRIPGYLQGIEGGSLNPTAEPVVIKETDTTLIVDGGNCLGHFAARQAMKWTIAKAKQANFCGLTLASTGHIGRLGEYTEAATREGCIGIVTFGSGCGGAGAVVPFGGSKGGLGTNPIAVGVPTGDDSPFIIDYATSMIAQGKIQVAQSKGIDLPEGSILDKHGNPSVKTADYFDGGPMLPFGGHKGYALSLLVCMLGGLSGNFDVEKGLMQGFFMQAINIEAYTPLEEYQQGVRALLDGMKRTPPAPGFDEVLVPGDFEYRARTHRLVHGIDLPDAIYRQICQCAEKLSVSMDDDATEEIDRQIYAT